MYHNRSSTNSFYAIFIFFTVINFQRGEAAQAQKNPLYQAVMEGDAAVKNFLQDNADVNQKATNGETLLHYAAQGHNQNIIRILRHYGAKIDVPDKNGKTALSYAHENSKRDTITKALQEAPGNPPQQGQTLFTTQNVILTAFVVVTLSILLYSLIKKKTVPPDNPAQATTNQSSLDK